MPAGRPRKPEPAFDPSVDRSLILRPGKGWTTWQEGGGEGHIEHTWWEARILHLPRDNATIWCDGSDLVGIDLWGCNGAWWCMPKPLADWQPMPADFA